MRASLIPALHLLLRMTTMDHYEREETVVAEGGIAMHQFQPEEGETVEVPKDQEDRLFSSLGLDLTGVTTMRVKNGSKVRNLLGFAFKKIKDESTRHIIFAGSGPAISKTITCVEIVKRNMKTLHQVTKIYHKRIAEFWNPKEEGLDRLKVTRHIPAIAILLSKEALDASEPGYQAPGCFSNLWTDPTQEKGTNKSQSRKRANADKSRPTRTSYQLGSASDRSRSTPDSREGKAAARKPSKKKKTNAQPKKDDTKK
ncbi:ribonuclease P protein subunit p25-like protein [Acanthaster planci]|uniref:Ribonuclease P protein subunit p25-like protein n=1 Tax=Acanthaster planci TaxID=133434 RepID=A0A8B7YE60_ACAPL|nr:ribonuclease P protein subunit p25-like protein [Acanthaster planci]